MTKGDSTGLQKYVQTHKVCLLFVLELSPKLGTVQTMNSLEHNARHNEESLITSEGFERMHQTTFTALIQLSAAAAKA